MDPAESIEEENKPSDTTASVDAVADVLVVGAGAAGLVAALKSRELGASVIIVEANYDIGGHAITSGAAVALGGGTELQSRYGVTDSKELLFSDLVDWSVVEPNGMPDYRYNDRSLIRAFADYSVLTFGFLVANGVEFSDEPPESAGSSTGNSALRVYPVDFLRLATPENPVGSRGAGLIRPLEESARSKGTQFLLNYHMDHIIREGQKGNVIGITASYRPRFLPGSTAPLKSYRAHGNIEITKANVNVRAKKAVIIATGGHSSNVNFRRIFDPRLTSEYQVAGEPYSFQDASGEIAAMTIGASLWGTTNQTLEHGGILSIASSIGCQYGYGNIKWSMASPIFPLVRAIGLEVSDYQDLILVNQAGKRFYNEVNVGSYPKGNTYMSIDPKCNPPIKYLQGNYFNSSEIRYTSYDYLNAALAPNSASSPPDYCSGPVWAIFDSTSVTREKWTLGYPYTDPDYFFEASSIEELAVSLSRNPHQKIQMNPSDLQSTVARYNSFVEIGVDSDFGKPKPLHKVNTPPFYAAWATPIVHDTRAGLRINERCQVIDLFGEVIPRLYCGGESAGGFSLHGLGRATCQGYIAGLNAATESSSAS